MAPKRAQSSSDRKDSSDKKDFSAEIKFQSSSKTLLCSTYRQDMKGF